MSQDWCKKEQLKVLLLNEKRKEKIENLTYTILLSYICNRPNLPSTPKNIIFPILRSISITFKTTI